ncbi:MAG: hypothetical protein NVSMB66_7740 [Candidatus Doudnabacteria bacterium]
MFTDIYPFVFVIIPFNNKFINVYNIGIKQACEELNLRCERVHEQTFESHIVEQIYKNIQEANLIIADLTDLNPNVYYELGYARALKKRIISISRSVNDLPFDLRSYPALEYGSPQPNTEIDYVAFKNSLKNKIEATIKIPNLDENIPLVFDASREIQGQKIDELLKRSSRHILFCGIHFQWSISDHRQLILERLYSGISIEYVVVDPENHSLIERFASTISVPKDELQRECYDGFEKLKNLAQEATINGCGQNLHIFVTKQEPLGRYYLFDWEINGGFVLAIPFIFALRSSHSPAYLYKSSSNIARNYIDSCMKLKNASEKHSF